MTNIIDGMDEVRFKAGKHNKKRSKEEKQEEKNVPLVLKNLKNGS